MAGRRDVCGYKACTLTTQERKTKLNQHVVFTVITSSGSTERRAYLRENVLQATLQDTNNAIWLRGKKEPIFISDSASDIARALGVWNPRGHIRLTSTSRDCQAIQYPVELLANSTFHEQEKRTQILSPDGQQQVVRESIDEIGMKLLRFDIHFEPKEAAEGQLLIF